MSVQDKQIKPLPSKAEVEQVLIDLINGKISCEEASTWASYWLINDFEGEYDKKVWDVVGYIAGADTPTTDRPYLFGKEDFEDWLAELNS